MRHMKGRLFQSFFSKRLRSKERRFDLIGQGLENAFAEKSLSSAAVKAKIDRVLCRTGNESLGTFSDLWWQAFIDVVRAGADDYKLKEDDLVSKTKALNKSALSFDSWLELYRICLVSGLFIVGMAVRALAEARILQCASASGADLHTVRQGLAVSLEHGDVRGAIRFIGELEARGEPVDRIEHGRWFINLVGRGVLEPLVGNGHAEKEMFSSLHGKRVAVVGPVPTKVPVGAEIDDYDWVAKFNYRGGDGGCDPETQGKRVDIAYYNIEQSKYIARKMSPAFLRDVVFPVFIKDKGYRVLKDASPKGRVLRNVEWLLLNSEFNAGPNAVYDILRFSPGELKVFNSDLMLTAGRFKGYWQPGAKEVNYCYSFAKTHDPVIQFRYFQRLWQTGVITGDAAFEGVMSLTLEDYIDRLQEAHGAIGRERICPYLRPQSVDHHQPG